jgi:opacity protein-like surface antigen
MFNYRTFAMIAVSVVIAAPALVFADFQQFSSLDDGSSRTQLASVPASGRNTRQQEGVAIAQHWQRDANPFNGSDFPVRGLNQFASQEPVAGNLSPQMR